MKKVVVLLLVLLSQIKLMSGTLMEMECDGYTICSYENRGVYSAGIISVSYETLEPFRRSGHLIVPEFFVVDGVEHWVRSIGNGVYRDMQLDDIVELTLPSECEVVYEWNFYQMPKLRKVNMGDKLTAFTAHNLIDMPCLEELVFSKFLLGLNSCIYNVGLTKLVLPNMVQRVHGELGSHALSNLPNLVELDLGGVQHLSGISLSDIPLLESVVIPGTCLSIGPYVFQNLPSLKSVTFAQRVDPDDYYIEENIMEIWGPSFASCPLLKDFYVEDAVPFEAKYQPFTNSFNFPFHECTLHVPAGSKEAYEKEPFWSGFGVIVEESASVDEIEPDFNTGMSLHDELWYSVDGRVVDPASYRGIAIRKTGSTVTKHLLK